ncbi:MAG: hypothetical protein JO006_07445 [Paucibacter sp.]|nr:hypothetical protein [Roseateles sp.]
MDLETIYAAAGGLLAGGVVALIGAASVWGSKLKAASQRIATLEESRQSAKDDNADLRKQIQRLQQELNDLRVEAMRARPRAEATATTRHEVEDLLLRAAPAAEEPFPATMIQPRRPQPEAEAPFPVTQILPRKP